MENTNPNPDMNGDVESDIASLSDKLNEYENKLGEMREVLLRERAEIENQRKRLQRDVEQARKFANERLLGDLLPVYDGLERGLMAEKADSAARRGATTRESASTLAPTEPFIGPSNAPSSMPDTSGADGQRGKTVWVAR